MKMTTGLIGLLLVTVANGCNSISDIVPPKYKFGLFAFSMFLGLAVQVLAHISNPDGTSANLPQGLTPDQLERYRKMFVKEPAE